MRNTQKSILITQSQLRRYSGSEVVTLELIEYFVQDGWKVTVLTHHTGAPIDADVIATGAEIITSSQSRANRLMLDDFDVVWIHHYTLTKSLVEQLTTRKRAKVVFHHMSFAEPMEFPIFSKIEENVADHILFNSKETMDKVVQELPILSQSRKVEVFDNPSPDSFLNKIGIKKGKKVKNIAVISNHPPTEIIDAMKLLSAQDVKVDFIGRVGGGHVQRVTPDVLQEYDMLISIGKTVQYAILAQIPIYCYDRFGGPGYLNLDNFKTAHYHNFSGRGFSQLSANRIAEDITSNYIEAKDQLARIHETEFKLFLLSNRIKLLLNKDILIGAPMPSIGDVVEFSTYTELMSRIVPQYLRQIHVSKQDIAKLNNKLNQANNQEKLLKDTNGRLARELNEIKKSKSMKLVNAIRKPLSALRRILR